ncbi:hypothetical protein Pcinc_038969 [Petrolisthes cinctipes]|uniref:Uncharacterized protein n=1 Tax=Petrolisthes cinctipes TaxID=88211 RepID=A0AAE1BPF2_PETCI|nr:hypothetical protein Pcinc_038969 [Petrolisthes cinctipes]
MDVIKGISPPPLLLRATYIYTKNDPEKKVYSFSITTMKLILVIALVTVVAEAAPERPEVVEILRDERTHQEDGTFSVDMEAANGIKYSEAGSPGVDGAIVSAGQYSYTAPDGSHIEIKFVADENGFQPASDVLPVAPAFPHEIPQFVLDQIAKAKEEDAAAAATKSGQPSQLYGVSAEPHHRVPAEPHHGAPAEPDHGAPAEPHHEVPAEPDHGAPAEPDHGAPAEPHHG